MNKEIKSNETKKCKHCQSDIPKKAKICVYCRKKQGGILKYVLIVISALFIIGVFQGGEEDQPKKVSSTDSNELIDSSTTENKEYFGVGDTAEYKNVKVTLNSITESKGSKYNKPADGNIFLLVNFTIENNTDTDIFVSSIMSFDAYQDGYSTSTSLSALIETEGEQLDGAIVPGKKMKGFIGYEVPSDYSEFEINYQTTINSKKINFLYKK
jgi:hypothetical protein